MAEKFRNKYRIPSARAAWWNYAWSADYFVTISAAHQQHFFGKITKHVMELSPLGQIAHDEWGETLTRRPDMNLSLGVFRVMPNHFHAIITIGANPYNGGACRDGLQSVSTNGLHPGGTDGLQSVSTGFGPQSKNLPAIIRGYKSAVTTRARRLNPRFGWQARYYDHIIRNDEEYQRITDYIINNPARWDQDRFYRS